MFRLLVFVKYGQEIVTFEPVNHLICIWSAIHTAQIGKVSKAQQATVDQKFLKAFERRVP